MSPLPTRGQAEGILILRNVQVANNDDGIAVVRAYVHGDLMTRAEFIASIDPTHAYCFAHQNVFTRPEAMICRGAPYACDVDCPKKLLVDVAALREDTV